MRLLVSLRFSACMSDEKARVKRPRPVMTFRFPQSRSGLPPGLRRERFVHEHLYFDPAIQRSSLAGAIAGHGIL